MPKRPGATHETEDTGKSVRFSVKVKPGARKTCFLTRQSIDQPYLITLKAEPVDGRANRALIEFIAREFGTRKCDVDIVRGHAARIKTLVVRHPRVIPAALSDILRT